MKSFSDNELSVIPYGSLIPDHISTESFCSIESSKARIIVSKRFNIVLILIL